MPKFASARFALVLAALAPAVAFAQSSPHDAGTSAKDAGVKSAIVSDAGARHLAKDAGALEDGNEMPHGHPSIEELMGEPHFPTDSVKEEATLPPGTIIIELKNELERPVAGASVTLGKIEQSIAKGESRSREELKTDDLGRIELHGLPTGSGMAFRVSRKSGPASFAARPFNLPQDKGVHVTLHEYPVTTSLESAIILTGLVIVAELREDRIQFDETITVANRTKVAWVPDNVIVALPDGYTAFVAQEAMSDQGVDAIPGKGVRLRGTFPPGQHQVAFRWQLPSADPWKRFLGEGQDLNVTIGGSPHLSLVQAIAAVTDPVKFFVDGFPPAVVRFGQTGERLLVTQRELHAGDAPMSDVRLQITNIPGPGRGPLVAVCVTLALLLLGVYLHARRDLVSAWFGSELVSHEERESLLKELEELEEAHKKGEIGPKTYERAHRELMQALARTAQKPAT